MRFPNLNALWAYALVEELRRASGLREVVVCPGSRSAPLALACAEHPALRTWSVVDERSAGFVALGIAKQSGVPALVVVTSGTAGAHLFPAILEAEAAGVPLLVLTADRPWELQGFGAPQTLDQLQLFGAHVRGAFSLPSPEANDDVIAHLRAIAARAGALARGPKPGPVHLNVPFREPLAPVSDGVDLGKLSAEAREGRPGGAPFLSTPGATRLATAAAIESARARIAQCSRGIIVCGPRDADDGLGVELAKLSAELGYPLLAEAASQVRWSPGSEAVTTYDALLRDAAWAERSRPELVLRFGGGTTSKRLQAWLDGSGAPTVLFSDAGLVFDPRHRALEVVEGSPVAAAHALRGARTPAPGWRQSFLEAHNIARRALHEAIAGAPLDEPAVASGLAAALPPGAQLFVASSMPVRDLDAYAHQAEPIRVLSNRGVNGIDGLVSSALGVAIASGKPTALLTGDLGLLHDVGGLLSARRAGVPLCIVVVNNDGGGIFSFLPIASATPHFEKLFGTPHGLSFEGVAAMAEARHHRPESLDALQKQVRSALEGGLTLIEVKTDRAANVARHEALGAQVVRALEGGGQSR